MPKTNSESRSQLARHTPFSFRLSLACQFSTRGSSGRSQFRKNRIHQCCEYLFADRTERLPPGAQDSVVRASGPRLRGKCTRAPPDTFRLRFFGAKGPVIRAPRLSHNFSCKPGRFDMRGTNGTGYEAEDGVESRAPGSRSKRPGSVDSAMLESHSATLNVYRPFLLAFLFQS
jgi:hypothetical protein